MSSSDTAISGILSQNALFVVPRRPVARMADQLSASHPRHASYGPSPEAFRHRIRPNPPLFPTSWPENSAPRCPRLWCRSRSSAGWRGPGRPRSSGASGTPAPAAAMPKPCRRPFGQAWGPSMPASAMILAIFRWAVARDQAQRGLPSPAPSGARGRAQGRGAAREGPGPRGSVRRGASGSGSGLRQPQDRRPWGKWLGLRSPGRRCGRG